MTSDLSPASSTPPLPPLPQSPSNELGIRRTLYYLAGLMIVLLVMVLVTAPEPVSSKYMGQRITFRGVSLSTDSGIKVFNLESHRGKVVLINFWATFCPYCLEEMPHLQRIYTDLKYDDFVVIGVSSDRRDRLEGFLTEQSQPWDNIFGNDAGRLGRKFDVNTIPRAFLINREGVLVAVGNGVESIQNEIYALVRDDS
ncbi:MAG: TlpA family protein disulfide reductase [Pirellulaceae bacterium]|nr:TlpA family protein disulfide reductase [Pirellulaceae bacterium]